MEKFIKSILNGLGIGLGIVIILIGSYNVISWNGLEAEDGNPLTLAKWNELVAKVSGIATDGSGKVTIESLEVSQPQWMSPSLLNGWAINVVGKDEVGYFKDSFGIVHLKGVVRGTTVGTCIFNLEDGYKPQTRKLLSIPSNGIINIGDDGCVKFLAGTADNRQSFDGVSFDLY